MDSKQTFSLASIRASLIPMKWNLLFSQETSVRGQLVLCRTACVDPVCPITTTTFPRGGMNTSTTTMTPADRQAPTAEPISQNSRLMSRYLLVSASLLLNGFGNYPKRLTNLWLSPKQMNGIPVEGPAGVAADRPNVDSHEMVTYPHELQQVL